jgi:hypothetical protein
MLFSRNNNIRRFEMNAIIARDTETGKYRVRVLGTDTVAGLFADVAAAERYANNIGATVVDVRS